MFINFLKANWRKIAAGVILCLVAAVLVINHESKKAETPVKFAASKDPKAQTVTLTITGEVVKPGVYQVKKGSSLMDNLHLFGGFTMYADISKIDVDSPLTKDITISVKTRSAADNRNYDSLYVMPE